MTRRDHTLKATILIVSVLALASVPGAAQEVCTSEDTVGACWERLSLPPQAQKKVETEAKAEMSSEIWQDLIGKTTGLDLSALKSGSTINDFLPLLRIAFGQDMKSGSDLGALNFERKIPLGDSSWELKIKGNRNEPDVYTPLKQAFADDVRDQQVAALKDKLETFDDYSLSLDANRKSENYGRSPSTASREVFATLFSQVVKDFNADRIAAADIAFSKALGVVNQRQRELKAPLVDATTHFKDIADPEVRQSFMAQLAASALELKQGIADLKALADSRGIYKVADLLNNQPQINGSGEYRARKGLTGPDESTLKVSYEYGFANLNKLRGRCARESDLATCYGNYLKDPTNLATLENGNRATFSVEYKSFQAFSADLPDKGVNLALPSAHSLVIAASFGRNFDLQALGSDGSRIDLTGKYEDVSNDPARQDRGVISLTYSNRFLKALGASLGLSYANHAEFLPKTDHELNAHFGISYRLFPEDPSKNVSP
jgi:hypothetical protein